MKMLRGVLVLRRVAAADMPTGHAQSQMDPFVAHLEALFATLGMRLHILNLAGVFAVFHRFDPLVLFSHDSVERVSKIGL